MNDMEEQLLELTGSVGTIIYRNEGNGYSVIELDDEDETIAVGIMPDVNVGEQVRLVGTFKSHPSYGSQFAVSTYEKTLPESVAGILNYLSSGTIKGIGPATASVLVKNFGSSTLEVLQNEPERVAKIKGFSLKKAQEVSERLKENSGIRELMLYLAEYEISPTSAVKIYKSFGSHSVEEIRRNPYCLSGGDFGIGFEKADAIALKQGHEREEKIRVRAGLAYVLAHNKQNGHTCLPEHRLISTSAQFLGVSDELTAFALESMVGDGSLIRYENGGERFIFEHKMFDAESYIATRLLMMLRFPAAVLPDIDKQIEAIEAAEGISYADLQKEAITRALSTGLLVLTGGPGTGKTTTLNAIIKILKSKGQSVLLCAPTGRAAQRMSEVTGEEAKTIHRLLEVAWSKNDELEFKKNEKNMLECDALIIDEVSMVDAVLMESVMKALPLGCRLILVGDSHQLPSVGPGNVLDDLVSSGIIPVVQLNEIFRQSLESLIITNAHRIVNGELPELKVRDRDFFFLFSENPENIRSTTIDLIRTRLPRAYGYDPYRDIQILAPGRKGELGVTELNADLQAVLNPADESKNELKVGKKIFREGDKVMQTRNNYDLLWTKDNGETGEGIFNGEMGVIEKISKKARIIRLRFDDKFSNYDFDFASDLDHAFATTVHKSQGNEFDAVVMPLFRGAPMLLYRNLLYTAVTRAKKLMIIVGSDRVIEQMVRNDRKNKRYSGLRYFLCESLKNNT